MKEEKLYYLGIGTEFIKAQCKKYKTLQGAVKAAEKDENLTVWDEDGNIIGTEKILPQNEAETSKSNKEKSEGESQGEAKDESLSQDEDDDENVSQQDEAETKATKVTVICEGSLNIRRTPEFIPNNICGRAVKGQAYYVKKIIDVADKKMIETIDGLYLSANPEFVEVE